MIDNVSIGDSLMLYHIYILYGKIGAQTLRFYSKHYVEGFNS